MEWSTSKCNISFSESIEFIKNYLKISQLDILMDRTELLPYQTQILKYLNSKLIALGTDVLKERVQAVLDIFSDGADEIVDLEGDELATSIGIDIDNENYEQDRFIFSWTNFLTSLCMRLKFQYAGLFTQEINQNCCSCGNGGQTIEDYESWTSGIYPEDENYDRTNYYRTNSNWGVNTTRYCDCYRNGGINE